MFVARGNSSRRVVGARGPAQRIRDGGLLSRDASVSGQAAPTVAALSERGAALPVDDATQEALEALRNGAE